VQQSRPNARATAARAEEAEMDERLLSEQSPLEFFRAQLERAMQHQKVSTSAFTEFYLANMLAVCVQGDPLPAPEKGFDEMPLALLYVRASEASRFNRARLLRMLGDGALFVSGFFGDSLNRKMVDLAYYRRLGGQAYARLSHEDGWMEYEPAVFAELARRFPEFTDVLAEVSENSRLTASDRSTLQLYERWVQTGSRRAAALLAERGITPVAPGESRPQ
jgi:hypothetical protein